jgi:hypothetical protein
MKDPGSHEGRAKHRKARQEYTRPRRVRQEVQDPGKPGRKYNTK